MHGFGQFQSPRQTICKRAAALSLAALLLTGTSATAQSLNLYGMPGLLDMPTAGVAPDAELSTTIGIFSGMTRNTFSFQITPRLTGSFRYTALSDCNCYGFGTYYDRSFDVHYQIFDQGRYRPALAVGLRDLIATRYSPE